MLGQPTGQNQGATGLVMPVSSVQYPSISGGASKASAPPGPMRARLSASQTPHAPYTAGPGTRPPLPSKEMTLSPPHVSDPVARELKSVSFPRNCMDWFTSIASINTAKNRETCGLLLGKKMGGHYVVTTLLIPKQHATSDTCAIDEEGLVMQFTEERSLIILGWVYRHLCWWIGVLCSSVRYCQIHTHPTQSCVCFLRDALTSHGLT